MSSIYALLRLRSLFALAVLPVVILAWISAPGLALPPQTVSLISAEKTPPQVAFGLREISRALDQKGIKITRDARDKSGFRNKADKVIVRIPATGKSRAGSRECGKFYEAAAVHISSGMSGNRSRRLSAYDN